MRLRHLVSLLLLSVAALAGGQARPQDQPQDRPVPASQPRPSTATIDQWQDRKIGMFIHFGLFSEFGGVYHGRRVEEGYSEQIMANGPIPLEEYAAAAKTFDPVKWDPDAIVALAKAAGMKYIVMTSKHHDGFNMFATKQTKYNVVEATPYHRDVVKELADACRRGGLAFGVYYSSIDWHEPGMDHYIVGNSNELSEAHARFNAAQIRELMTQYGPISEIWFDMGKPTPEQSKLFTTTVHTLQPQTMVSGRVWNYQGDFTVMGDNEVPAYGIDEPWQTPASIFADTWGYRSWERRTDADSKIREKIQELVQVVSKGGNYILNIGPEGDGSVVPYEAEVLKGVGSWLKVNGEAIYGTRAAPLETPDFGFITVKGDDVYLLLKKPARRLLLPRTAKTRWKDAVVLRTGAALRIRSEGDSTAIYFPGEVPEDFLPVIRLRTEGGLKVDPVIPARNSQGVIVLTEKDAETFYNYNGRGYEDSKTLYKLRWHLPAGCSSLTFHGTGAGLTDLVTESGAHQARLVDGAVQQVVVGADTSLELTPPEPFVKGTALLFTPTSIDVGLCSQKK